MNKFYGLHTSFTLERMAMVLLMGFFWLSIGFGTSHVLAEELSPLGRWKTISDKTGEATSIVTITQEDKVLVGKITELFRKPGQNPNPICKKCPDDQQDQPVIGLTILSGLQQDEDEWNGGEILDPDNGKTYSCFVKMIENGSKLEVRGYIGISLLGRTQTWVRED